jgi:hypothetical protein
MQILLEHDNTPGTFYREALILGGTGAILNEMVDLNESTDVTSKTVKFRGKFQEAEAINKNRRQYPFKVLDENVKRLTDSIGAGGLCGELDHPSDSIIHFANASHKITKLWWESNNLMGEGIILNTPSGRILRALINDGVRIGISSRGVGNGKVNEEGILVIGESYKLITFDAVADPSTYAAFQERVGSKRESVLHPAPESQNSAVSAEKNENSGIHMNEALLLACLEGIIKDQINNLKARIGNE